MTLIYVALGGALGSVIRYLMTVGAGQVFGKLYPYGTLIVNISGSLIMGLFIGWMARAMPTYAENARLFVAVGVLGGYTTFSSFSLDAITLFESGQWSQMTIYILTSVIGSLLALLAGLLIVRAIA